MAEWQDRLRRMRWKAWTATLMTNYGLSREQFDGLLIAQCGRCATCGKLSDRRGLYVDHCHASGAVRGLLCPSCNMLVGVFEKRRTLLAAVESYVMGPTT